MFRTVFKFPFLTYAIACIALLALAISLQAVGAGYDDGGVGGIGALFFAVSEYVAFPLHAAIGAISVLPRPWNVVLGCVLVAAICLAADTLIQRVWRRGKAA